MTKAKATWASAVKPGDFLQPVALWNRTTRLQKLDCPTRIAKVKHNTNSQSKVRFFVESRITSAQNRYGDFASNHEAMGVALGEWDDGLHVLER